MTKAPANGPGDQIDSSGLASWFVRLRLAIGPEAVRYKLRSYEGDDLNGENLVPAAEDFGTASAELSKGQSVLVACFWERGGYLDLNYGELAPPASWDQMTSKTLIGIPPLEPVVDQASRMGIEPGDGATDKPISDAQAFAEFAGWAVAARSRFSPGSVAYHITSFLDGTPQSPGRAAIALVGTEGILRLDFNEGGELRAIERDRTLVVWPQPDGPALDFILGELSAHLRLPTRL